MDWGKVDWDKLNTSTEEDWAVLHQFRAKVGAITCDETLAELGLPTSFGRLYGSLRGYFWVDLLDDLVIFCQNFPNFHIVTLRPCLSHYVNRYEREAFKYISAFGTLIRISNIGRAGN